MMKSSSALLIYPGVCLALVWLILLVRGGGARFKTGLAVASVLYLFYIPACQDSLRIIALKQQLSQEFCAITGWVEKVGTYPGGQLIQMRPAGVTGSTAIKIFYAGQFSQEPGDLITIRGYPRYQREIPPRHWLWWDPFDLSGWTLSAPSGAITLKNAAAFDLRRLCIKRLKQVQGLSIESKALLKALLFGDRSELAPSLSESASKTGVSHILALSGMHLGMYISALTLLTRRKGFRIKIAGIFLFALLSGGGASAMRAVATGLYLVAAGMIRSVVSTREAFYRVLLGLIWLNPAYLFDLGFRLSVVAVWALALHNSFSAQSPRPAKLIGSGLVVTAAIMPFCAGYFGTISLWGPVLTIVCSPIAMFLVFTGIIALPFLVLGTAEWFYLIFGRIVDFLTGGLEELLLSAVRLPGISVTVGTVGLAALGASLLAVAGIAKSASRQAGASTKAISTSLGCYLVVLGILQGSALCQTCGEKLSPWFTVTALDVGHGDAFYLHFPGNATMLIDAGGAAEWDLRDWIGRTVIGNYLTYCGRTSLDTVMVSHWHTDHTGGMIPVLAQFAVHSVVSPGGLVPPLMPAPTFPDGRFAAERGLAFSRGKVTGVILSPSECGSEMLVDPNSASVVFRVQYGLFSMLFSGDIPVRDQEKLAAANDGASVVFKIPHHGGYSLSSQWLNVVNPIVALVSGAGQRKGQPNQDTLSKLSLKHPKLLRTDLSGNIRFASDGKRLQITTTTDGPARLPWYYQALQTTLRLL